MIQMFNMMSNIYDKDVIAEIKLRDEVVTSHINTPGIAKKAIKGDKVRKLEITHCYREHQRYGMPFPKKLPVQQI